MGKRWHFDRDEDEWYCESCERWFCNKDAILQHLNNSNSHNFCNDCERDFQLYSGLRSHWIQSNSHHFCTVCNTDFDDDDELEEHHQHEHYWCKFCDDTGFEDETDLEEHQREEHYRCDACDEAFETFTEMQQHWEDSHWYCRACDKHFNNENNLKAHLNSSKHKPKTIECPFKGLKKGCKQTFISLSAVALHLEAGKCPSGAARRMIDEWMVKNDTKHLITNPRLRITDGSYTPPPKYKATPRAWNGTAYECYFCNATFTTIPQLDQHLESPKHASGTVNGEKIYRCPNISCRTEFSTLSGAVQHIEFGSCGIRKMKGVERAIDAFVEGFRKRLTL
ncbi:hypothetical protein PUNSTDRAFT_142347 [Punctularia strigosozonata HHB-11173 SS5]|uniref:uncharacterized protein n=1 Tax=Punctularia strigosozonata (strain HHB-11173) TaxID=741275 RepID=UPI0004417827|nr:uncharacterized protein PUNSTDRAFT_142347 [Punctularia strigosozonata HHB-11173 SS5]EIN10289.1 hypothetical protein PUNSTDRAFT_142347 [Punctularia strigosozonata HHB-11173 SS5]